MLFCMGVRREEGTVKKNTMTKRQLRNKTGCGYILQQMENLKTNLFALRLAAENCSL